jgi:DNA-binding transcriptional regulator YhcF (GntR family)
MRQRTAQEYAVQHAFHPDVVEKATRALHQSGILDTRDRLSDPRTKFV